METTITKGTIARTIVLLFAVINQILTATGHSILPIESETVAELVSTIITIVTALIAWWKNNSFTKAAQTGDVVMHALKDGEDVDIKGVQ